MPLPEMSGFIAVLLQYLGDGDFLKAAKLLLFHML